MELFKEYVNKIHKKDILQIMKSSEIHNNYAINIDFLKLFETDPLIGDGILCNSKNILPKCDQIIIEVQNVIYGDIDEEYKHEYNVKYNVHVRFYGLPACPELHRTVIPKNKDLGCFLKITGTAIRVTQAKMLEYKKSYKCVKCNYVQIVEGQFEQRFIIKSPSECKNPKINCRSSKFTPVHCVLRDNCKDYQEMKIQEQVNKLAVGGIPGSIWVALEDDLVDSCKPGDDVSICGTVLRRWHPLNPNKKCEVELVFRANHLEVVNAQKSITVSISPDVKVDFSEFWSQYERCPMKGRDVILASVCPKVYGLYMVKLALILTVITGCNHNLEIDEDSMNKTISPNEQNNERSIRGQCHLLLVGDPGTGKSQLLNAGAMLTSRSILTSGSGSTKAGLTCTAIREDGEWQLEAGALVLADGGACCIDELAQMREHDRASIHEAMEQQTISVAKAGIICKLNTRCAVIAACNPKGHYDTEQPLSINVSLGTPLLSRFDLIFILLDTQCQSWDELVADYILFGKTKNIPNIDSWSLEKLQLYVSLIGPYDVTMTQKATTILQAYYIMQRRSENRDPCRTTVRMLDSLVRLSQAHARLMYRKVVYTVDAVMAVSLVDLSMQDCTITGSSDILQTNFSKYPDYHYLRTAKSLLHNLQLHHLWEDELSYYARLLKVDRQHLNSDLERECIAIFEQFECLSKAGEANEEIIESTYFKKNVKFAGNQIDDHDSDVIPDSQSKAESLPQNDAASTSNFQQIDSRTKDLLAKTLKKHSTMNMNSKVHYVGEISGLKKPKRNLNKNKKDKASKRKRNDHSDTKYKKNKKQAINVIENCSSSSGEDEGFNMLNYIPSVNDVFNGLDINLNISDDEEGSRSEVIQMKSVSHNSCTVTNNEKLQENVLKSVSPYEIIVEEVNSIQKENIPTNSKDVLESEKISPIHKNTMKKLLEFSFKSRITDDINKDNIVIDTDANKNGTEKEESEDNRTVCSNKSKLPISEIKFLNKAKSVEKLSNEIPCSLRSIFETEDDYDALDL